MKIVLGAPLKALVQTTITYLSGRTCLTFVENAAAANRVKIYNGGTCSSFTGMVGGEQLLSLTGNCATTVSLTLKECICFVAYQVQLFQEQRTKVTCKTLLTVS